MRTRRNYQIGDEITGPVRGITNPRIEWYDSAMLSAATGELRQVGSNIHTDEEFARSEGFSGVNADGMIMTNWCSEMLAHTFGMDYIERGELRTKYIKPVLLGVLLHVKGRVKGKEPAGNDRTRYELAVWCEDEHGNKLVDGDAAVEIANT
ncbi:MAG TPA: MaoC family dehydratase [Acetobacteraceae bacterium]